MGVQMSIELKDEWVEKALAAYEDSLADDPFHSAKTAIRANLTAIIPLIEAEVREQCAKVAASKRDGDIGEFAAGWDAACSEISQAIRGIFPPPPGDKT